MSSFLLRGLAANGGIRVVAADTTSLVQEAKERHASSATASAALGRSLSATALLSHVLLKNPKDRITLKIIGDGPLGGIITEGGLDGLIRGYTKHSDVDLPLREDGKLNVGMAVGKGELEVIRSHAPRGEPYSSSVKLYSGEIADDVAVFLAESEQIQSAVLLGVYQEADRVTRTGGVILQALPNAEEAALTLLEANIKAMGALTEAMGQRSLLEILGELCWGLELEILTEKALPLSYTCRCSREKILGAMRFFSPEELQDMIDQDGGAEAICHWCNERYWLEPSDLEQLLQNHNN